MLSTQFLQKYRGINPPFSPLGQFVELRTYSRLLPDEGRRETWFETVKRSVEYNTSLAPIEDGEDEMLFDNMFNLRQSLSGRTLWVGGTDVSTKFPMANFNCAFFIMNEYEKLKELFYLLMLGTGVGIRILPSDVDKLPKVRTDIEFIHRDYESKHPSRREELTSLEIVDDTAIIKIGDSKEGWSQSIGFTFDILTKSEYNSVQAIVYDYDNVRPKGERLKTFGGTASGHETLRRMFENISKILNGTLTKDYPKIINRKLRPIHIFDITCSIGSNVVSGGVRRTALNHLIGQHDTEMITAKSNVTPEIDHRYISNNSIFYMEKPSMDFLKWQMETLKLTGEPCFFNQVSAKKRREDVEGCNPCFEILLRDRGLCNLTTLNVYAFVENGKLNYPKLLKAQRLSARASFRMTIPQLELHKWNEVQQEDRLCGVSLTGWQDMVGSLNLTKEQEIDLQNILRVVAIDEVNNYADELGINRPLLVTTVKPEGTISKVFNVSEGLHYKQAPYYIQRVRINAHDPLAKTAIELGWDVKPENNQTWENATTLVVSFPVKSNGKTIEDVSAIAQLELYKEFQQNYTQHNSSNTISVREHEWEEVTQWLYDNWDEVIGVSFLPLMDAKYEQMPKETITKECYEKMLNEMKPLDMSILQKHEDVLTEFEIIDEACSTGACPIR